MEKLISAFLKLRTELLLSALLLVIFFKVALRVFGGREIAPKRNRDLLSVIEIFTSKLRLPSL